MIDTITQQLISICNKYPNKIAFDNGEQSCDYQTLNQKVINLAAFLDTKLNDNSPIVIYGDFELEMLVSMLAATRCGHAYIPVEIGTPKDRIENILNVAQPSAIINIGGDWEVSTEFPVISLTDIKSAINSDTEFQAHPVQGDENLYIIFTSGTTGVPKGVQISNDNLQSFVDWFTNIEPIQVQQNFLLQAPFSFDLSVMSLYPSLLTGGCLRPLKKSVINNFKSLFETLPQLDLNIWVSTPSFMDICLMAPEFNADNLPSLSQFYFCGEELSQNTAKKLLEKFPDASIYNTYGPTEATVAISAVKLVPEMLSGDHRLPIGYVKSDTKVEFFDEESNSWSSEQGEITISGPSVSKGYLNNPEKTQQAFIEKDGKRVYRTGDAGSMNSDQMLLYNGRIDFQVKWHGYRIELEDIDAHLNQVSLVTQAIVVPKYQKNSLKVQNLIAFVVADKNDFASEFELTKAIKNELARGVMDYMIPQRIVYVDAIPQTPNGKLDRKGLMNEVNTA